MTENPCTNQRGIFWFTQGVGWSFHNLVFKCWPGLDFYLDGGNGYGIYFIYFSFPFFLPRCLSVLGFVINIDTLIMMVPEQLRHQQYICTYRFSQDHLELLFNSIRAAGGWNNNPNASQLRSIFRHLMVRCGVTPSTSGNVTHQDGTVSLAAVELSCVIPAEDTEDLPCPFANLPAVLSDHSYLPTRFGSLVDNALVYISGFVVKGVLKKLPCAVCRMSLVGEAIPSSFDSSYHLLNLRNKGGLVIPSKGTIKVVRSAEKYIRQHDYAGPVAVLPQIKTLHCLNQLVRADIGSEDVFQLGKHIQDTQYGIDNHHYDTITLVVSTFYKVRMHHIAKLDTFKLQMGNSRKKIKQNHPVPRLLNIKSVVHSVPKNIVLQTSEKKIEMFKINACIHCTLPYCMLSSFCSPCSVSL
ncbi:hypothetical protein ACEWY4_001561 [Coilia grayii]|uniref:Transposable element P transposase-like RNase H C-terminal domain-containing protein n=1 Tax=Coilia grayii TaxID=363190 RepID=A0ABD1KUF9_9TELE